MSLVQTIKRHLGLEPIEEKLQRFEEIKKSFEESDLQLDELAKDFFIEKSVYEARMKEPENFPLQSKIQEKFDTFIKGHKESIRKAKKQFDSLKKEKEEIEKAFSNHKYIRKEPDGKGGWNYVYDENLVSHKWGNDDVINPSKIFLNPVKQKTKDDITTFFMRRFGVKSSHNVPLSKRKDSWDEGYLEKINVKDIVPSQDYINMTSLKEEKEEGVPYGISVQNSNKIILFNGHHRVAEKILNGDSEVEIKIIPSFGLFKQYSDINKSFDSEEKETAYEKIKKAYQHGQISLDSFNTIIKGLTNDEKTKYSDFLLFNEKGELLLLKRSSWEDDNAGAWVIPGGHVDPGEDFKTTAIRELREESGYNVDDAENVGSYEDEKCHIEYFQAYINTSEKPLLLQFSEVRDYKWIPVNEICEEAMVFNMRDNVMKVLGIEDQDRNKKIIRKAILAGIIPAELIEKAKSGIYKPTAENKKLGRVGQKYGEKKEDVLSKVLNKVESEIVNLKYEHGYCFDERGNEIFNHTDHQVDGIDLTQFKDQLKNNIFTHNHPRNNAHSIHDIAVCLLGQIKEYRTVVLASDRGHGSYVFENKTDKTIDLSLYEEDVSNKYKEWFESIKDYRQVEEGWIEVFRMTEIYKENANNLQFYFQLVNGDKIKI